MLIPKIWEEKLKQLLSENGATVIVLGGIDSGKTTFVKYLVEALCKNHRRVAFVDCDIGQSTIGPPTTLGMTLYENCSEISDPFAFCSLQFVGSTTPVGHMLPMIAGLKKINDKAHDLKPEFIVVDTTGYTQGPGAFELKHAKIELLRPSHIIAFQKSNELESLLSLYRASPKILICRIKIGVQAKPKSAEHRRSYREGRFREYFRKGSNVELSLEKVGIWGTWFTKGKRLETRELNYVSRLIRARAIYGELNRNEICLMVDAPFSKKWTFRIKNHFGVAYVHFFSTNYFENWLVSLNDEEECLALGSISHVDVRTFTLSLFTPLKNLDRVRRVYFGSLKIGPSGEEVRP